MSATGSIEDIERYAFDFETIGMAQLFPVWQIYREMRNAGVVVSLDGLGADELLIGYPHTLREVLRGGSVIRTPRRALAAAAAISSMVHGERRHAFAELAAQDPFLRSLRDAVGSRSGITRQTGDRWIPDITIDDDWMAADDPAAISQLTPFNRSLYRQYHHHTLPSVLRKYDRLSMAHGVESRVPFLDWRLACYAFALPDTAKLRGDGRGKRILSDAMRGVVPDVVLDRRKKIGFRAPLTNWMNGALGPFTESVVRSRDFQQSTLWDARAITHFVAERNKARSWTPDSVSRVWRYVQAQLWMRSFFAT